MLYRRKLSKKIVHASKTDPVMLLTGARRVGKSTLMQQLMESGDASHYLTFDHAVEREAATADPEGYINDLPPGSVIDEVQRAPDVLLAIKAAVDSDPKPGRFLLTGSADLLVLPRIADALMGRMRRLTLWPLSQGEILQTGDTFVDLLFKDKLHFPQSELLTKDQLIERVVEGGFPQMIGRSHLDRASWAEDYLDTLIQRDLQELAGIRRLNELSRLIRLIATRTTGLLNLAEYSRTLGLPVETLKRYIAWLENSYVVRRIPAWHRNIGKRLVKSEKLIMVDSGLLAGALAIDRETVQTRPDLFGPLFENFVAMELIKQLSFSDLKASLFHYRDSKGVEVDYVIETHQGKIAGIEVKAKQTVDKGDFRGLIALQERVGKDFNCGVLLHGGSGRAVSFGDRLIAAPIANLWA